jgi:hypothetical protein
VPVFCTINHSVRNISSSRYLFRKSRNSVVCQNKFICLFVSFDTRSVICTEEPYMAETLLGVLRSLIEDKGEKKTRRLRKLRSEEPDKGNLRQILLLFFWRNGHQWSRSSSFTRFLRSHTTTHHSR